MAISIKDACIVIGTSTGTHANLHYQLRATGHTGYKETGGNKVPEPIHSGDPVISGNMEKIAASVIVPAKNAAHCVTDCLDALNAQTFTRDKYEIILVDDGSTDDTAVIGKSRNISVMRTVFPNRTGWKRC